MTDTASIASPGAADLNADAQSAQPDSPSPRRPRLDVVTRDRLAARTAHRQATVLTGARRAPRGGRARGDRRRPHLGRLRSAANRQPAGPAHPDPGHSSRTCSWPGRRSSLPGVCWPSPSTSSAWSRPGRSPTSPLSTRGRRSRRRAQLPQGAASDQSGSSHAANGLRAASSGSRPRPRGHRAQQDDPARSVGQGERIARVRPGCEGPFGLDDAITRAPRGRPRAPPHLLSGARRLRHAALGPTRPEQPGEPAPRAERAALRAPATRRAGAARRPAPRGTGPGPP